MEDVSNPYQNALVSGGKHSTLDIRSLCMQKPAHSARRALNRKCGTPFSWDLTDPQQVAEPAVPQGVPAAQGILQRWHEWVLARNCR
ncbi:hypothetical protein LPJ66_002766 [Kickxella alabastrina]|uniref:Uncharacterized protein n=1 Tax=Kickxella alabastrina TaxID=61397 RepID=A0ACC1IPI8_9FUNG|nr:hypothetical protein LPJ66_002766 [Kickxella alabastrina]